MQRSKVSYDFPYSILVLTNFQLKRIVSLYSDLVSGYVLVMDVNSSLPQCSSQYLIVFGYVTNLGIVHAAQYRINCGHSLLKDKEAYATHLESNPNLEGSKIK